MAQSDTIQTSYDYTGENPQSLVVPDSLRDRLVQEKESIRTSTSYASDYLRELGLKTFPDDVLNPAEANERYGVDGVLQFQEPISRSLAQLKYTRVRKGQLIDGFLSQAQMQDQSFGRAVRDFGNALAVQAFDPINYIPTTRMLKMSKLAGLGARGSTRIAHSAARGAVDGALGNLITTPFAAAQYKKYGMEYGLEDALFEVSMGVFIGGAIGGIGGKLSADKIAAEKIIARQRKNFKRQYKTMASQITPEARAALDDYITVVNRDGKIPSIEEMSAIVKVFDEQTPYKESGTGQVFTGQTLLRTNTEFLTQQEIVVLTEQARSDKFFAIEEAGQIAEKVSLDEVKTLQQRLLQTESISDLDFEKFKTEVTDLVNKFKDADVNIKNLEKLSPEDQVQVLKLMKALQEANLDSKQYRNLIRDLDVDTIRELHDQANFSREVKDSIPLDKAYETMNKLAKGEFAEPPEPNLLGEDFDVNVETGSSQKFLDEKVRLFKETMAEADLKEISKDLDKVDADADSFVKKIEVGLDYLRLEVCK